MDSRPENFSQILRASSVVGGSEFVNVIFGFVRTKVVAILIGPTGIGLLGLFQSIVTSASALAGLGIPHSGVKNVSSAISNGDGICVARTIVTLRRISLLTGSVGMMLIFAIARELSFQTFGNHDYVSPIRSLGIAVLFGNVTAGEMAIIQGARRIGDIARIAVLVAVSSTIVSVIIYLWLGTYGIVPALLSMSAVSLVASRWFSSRISIPTASITWRDSLMLASGLVTLGLAFAWTGFLHSLVVYFTNVAISRGISVTAVGIHAAAYSVSGLFVQFLLRAMGQDYYPRLSLAANDNERMNRMINEQTEIGLLLVFPGLLATLSFAPLVLQGLYSREFVQSTELLRWFVMGCIGRVVSWPMGFAMIAKGRACLFAATQTAFHGLHLLLVVLGIHHFGINGVAMGFFALYMVHVPCIFVITRRLTGFGWSRQTFVLFGWMVPAAVSAFILSRWIPQTPMTIFGGGITFGTLALCLRQITDRVGPDHLLTRLAIESRLGRLVSLRWIWK